MTVFVLFWRYYDGSGMEVVRVYTDKQRAQQDFELANLDNSRQWVVVEVPMFTDGQPPSATRP